VVDLVGGEDMLLMTSDAVVETFALPKDQRLKARDEAESDAHADHRHFDGRPLFSAQFEDGRFVLLAESDDVLVMTPQPLRRLAQALECAGSQERRRPAFRTTPPTAAHRRRAEPS
jgi:hypothetical protein